MNIRSHTGIIFYSLIAVLLLSLSLSALEYELSDEGLDAAEFEGGHSEFEFADINQDGHVDFVSIGDHGSPNINVNIHGIMVFFGNGAGAWDIEMNGDFGYGGVAVGDVDNDGQWDVGYGMHHNYNNGDFGNQMLEVALGDGSGVNWEPWDDGLGIPEGNDDWWGLFGTDFGDFNNDGLLDIGSNSFGSGTGLHLYSNNGDGTWEDVYYHFGRNNSAMHFVFGDINNDGNLDFVASLQNRSIHFGDGQGNFEMASLDGLPEFGVLGIMGIDLADVDNDGDDDLAFINDDLGIEVFSYDADNEQWLEQSANLPNESNGYNLTDLCDMDLDGNMDIITTGLGGVQVWLQDPEGETRWNQAWNIEFEDFRMVQALRVGGDVDHNGHPDIVALVNLRTGMMSDQNFLHVLKETSVPEELWIHPVEPGGSEVFNSGSVQFIDWLAAIPEDFDADEATVDLFFSARGADGPFSPVVEGYSNGGRYQWTVPRVTSRNCYIGYRLVIGADTVSAVTPRPFTIIGGEAVPMLSVEPMAFEFENVAVGQSDGQILTISNTGFGNLTVQAPQFDAGEAFIVDWGDEPVVLEPEESLELPVTFEPQDDGFWVDVIHIESDGGNADVSLLGITPGVVGPMIETGVDTLDFGRVRIGEAAEVELVITSSGDYPATVNLAGMEGVFAWEPVEGVELEPGDSIVVDIRFEPDVYGEHRAVVEVWYERGQAQVGLNGFGFGQAVLVSRPDSLDFGQLVVGGESFASLSILNIGDEPALVNCVDEVQDAFAWRQVREHNLEPGDSLDIEILFNPTEGGLSRAEALVTYGEEFLSIPLYGWGIVGPLIVLSSDTLDFGEILVDERQLRILAIYNAGNLTAVTSVGRPQGNGFRSNIWGDYEIEPGDSLEVRVFFEPWIDMDYASVMTVSYQNDDFDVVLQGRAVTEHSVIDRRYGDYEFGFGEVTPNPFNEELKIEYTLDNSGLVTLSMYSISGHKVRVIEENNHRAGSHEITTSFSSLSSGTYFLQLRQSGQIALMKVVHIK